MKCYCCNHTLSTKEAVRKFKESGAFTEMCDTCLNTITEVETVEGEAADDELFDDEGSPLEEW